MSYLLHVAITWSSRTLPPACAIYFTPLRWARSMLSPNGKKASEPSDTFSFFEIHSVFSSKEIGCGFSLKNCCQFPSAKTSSLYMERYTSIVLSRSARLMSSFQGKFNTFGCCLSHHVSALSPASRVQ